MSLFLAFLNVTRTSYGNEGHPRKTQEWRIVEAPDQPAAEHAVTHHFESQTVEYAEYVRVTHLAIHPAIIAPVTPAT